MGLNRHSCHKHQRTSRTITSLRLMSGAFRWLGAQFVVFVIFMLIGMVSQRSANPDVAMAKAQLFSLSEQGGVASTQLRWIKSMRCIH
jgi:hypothetical protein